MILENLFIQCDYIKSIFKKYDFSDTLKYTIYQYQVSSRGMTLGGK